MKKCFKCNVDKELSEYYKHKKMGDGHLNKCKICTRKDTKERLDVKLKEPEFIVAERQRHREKYYRLEYKEKHKQSNDKASMSLRKYRAKFPEKRYALNKSQLIEAPLGTHRHHWSYDERDATDVIFLTPKNHALVHRYMIYDQERLMYRRVQDNVLLDTRESHEKHIKEMIELYKDDF